MHELLGCCRGTVVEVHGRQVEELQEEVLLAIRAVDAATLSALARRSSLMAS